MSDVTLSIYVEHSDIHVDRQWFHTTMAAALDTLWGVQPTRVFAYGGEELCSMCSNWCLTLLFCNFVGSSSPRIGTPRVLHSDYAILFIRDNFALMRKVLRGLKETNPRVRYLCVDI